MNFINFSVSSSSTLIGSFKEAESVPSLGPRRWRRVFSMNLADMLKYCRILSSLVQFIRSREDRGDQVSKVLDLCGI